MEVKSYMKTDMKREFRRKIQTEGHSEQALQQYLDKQYKQYDDRYSNKDAQEYLHHVIAAIMLTQNERFKDFTVEIPYRFKAPKSTKDKIQDEIEKYASKNPIIYSIKTQEPLILIREILDIFAMKVVACNRPPTFYSNDLEIEQLVKEKMENHIFLGEMQKFKANLIEDEFRNPKNYQYNCTKVEYLEKCKCLLERIKTLIHPEATNLLKKYDKQIMNINNSLYFIKAANNEDILIDKNDLTNKKMNFFKLLNDFTSRIHDKLDLAVLTKQFNSLFENNERFKELGVSLNGKTKQKRTKDGFVSNFVYIDTLLGTIECQLQSQHEYEEGNYGYAAHTKLTGKAIKPLPIPKKGDKLKIKQFIKKVKEIAPKSFLARMDDTEKNRVITQQFSDYQNYKNVTSQVAEDDPCKKYILDYFSKLYAMKDDIFTSKEKNLGFLDYDLQIYLKSKSFQNLKEQVTQEIEIDDSQILN